MPQAVWPGEGSAAGGCHFCTSQGTVDRARDGAGLTFTTLESSQGSGLWSGCTSGLSLLGAAALPHLGAGRQWHRHAALGECWLPEVQTRAKGLLMFLMHCCSPAACRGVQCGETSVLEEASFPLFKFGASSCARSICHNIRHKRPITFLHLVMHTSINIIFTASI